MNRTKEGSLQRVGDVAKQLGLAITPSQQKRAEACAAIRLAPPESDEIGYLHAAICQVFFPRRYHAGPRYEGQVGSTSVLIKSGELNAGPRIWIPQPIPYGGKVRLVLISLISAAVKTGSPKVDVGKSTHEFMQRLQISGQGSEYKALRQQIAALAAADVRFGYRDSAGKDHTVKGALVEEFDMFTTKDERQITLWPQTVTLSDKFFTSVQEHAVPLDLRAVQALRRSAMSLDLYAFLSHRLYRVHAGKGLSLSWGLLKHQFGHEFGDLRDFRKEFRRSLKQVKEQYPAARVEEFSDGVILRQSPPPVLRRLVAGIR